MPVGGQSRVHRALPERALKREEAAQAALEPALVSQEVQGQGLCPRCHRPLLSRRPAPRHADAPGRGALHRSGAGVRLGAERLARLRLAPSLPSSRGQSSRLKQKKQPAPLPQRRQGPGPPAATELVAAAAPLCPLSQGRCIRTCRVPLLPPARGGGGPPKPPEAPEVPQQLLPELCASRGAGAGKGLPCCPPAAAAFPLAFLPPILPRRGRVGAGGGRP